MEKTVLITGVAGLMGSRLADWIFENHPEVKIIGIDNLSGGYRENVNSKVQLWEMDLVTQPIENCFEVHKPDFVFHFAAYAPEGLSPFMRNYQYQNNLIATARIINNCINFNVQRLVFTSTMAVYGKGNPPFDESHIPAPVDPYGIAKYACEMDIQVAGEQHGLDWCIIRPHNVYGNKQNIWDKYRNVLGIWMYQHLNGLPMTIYGDGEQKRAFSFIDDCLEPLWKAAIDKRASRQIINVGSSTYHTINQANQILKEVIGGGQTIYKEARDEVKNAHPTWKKSQALLDYIDKTDLKTGLEIMWDWAKKQPLRKQFVWDKYEIEKGIYSYWKKV